VTAPVALKNRPIDGGPRLHVLPQGEPHGLDAMAKTLDRGICPPIDRFDDVQITSRCSRGARRGDIMSSLAGGRGWAGCRAPSWFGTRRGSGGRSRDWSDIAGVDTSGTQAEGDRV